MTLSSVNSSFLLHSAVEGGIPPAGGGSSSESPPRPDYDLIEQWIPRRARVLDLGCGDGALLQRLISRLGVRGYGVEIDDTAILSALQNGVNVVQGDLDAGLSLLGKEHFDRVILSQTLPAIRQVSSLLQAIVRMGSEAIVSFPNFAHEEVVVYLQKNGRMPVSMALPYRWHSTPNIHLCTLLDFEDLCHTLGIVVLERVGMVRGQMISHLGTMSVDSPLLLQLNRESSLGVYRIKQP